MDKKEYYLRRRIARQINRMIKNRFFEVRCRGFPFWDHLYFCVSNPPSAHGITQGNPLIEGGYYEEWKL